MSDTMQFDLTVFKNEDDENESECNKKTDYIQCQSMKRLFVALKYYSMLNITENENDKDFFEEFINDIYYQLIDDYIHLNNYHSHQLEKINNDINNNLTMFVQCQTSSCAYTFRHHKIQKKKNKLNHALNFYVQTMDSLHFYLFHCFDVGLRTKQKGNGKNIGNTDKKKDSPY
eukprot:21900_1